ncbi:MAG: DUF2218 domain-containing protein [Segniliparus sp.]|uniref:DUF2218 domain-containing protein n=1 Tax=Segniliparus sp. TaxID=2804064 RepID=UPI003F29F9C1
MTEQAYTAASRAAVATDRSHRYGKQLVAHLGRKHGGEWDADAGSGWIELAGGRATVAAAEDSLQLRVVASDEDSLTALEDVVGRHLVRFGEQDGLSVTWERDGEAR